MTEAHAVDMPPGGWTVDDLDSWPETLVRHELTDGALTMSPSPSSLHQAVSGRLFARLDSAAPPDVAVTQAVEIRFGRRLTRIPDLLVVRSPEPARHWFAPSEVLLAVEVESPGSHTEDRVTKPALYARHGIPHYWRLELGPLRARVHRLADGDVYRETAGGEERLVAAEPFAVDLALDELLPGWAR
jgi:Uma2 family endonuclease